MSSLLLTNSISRDLDSHCEDGLLCMGIAEGSRKCPGVLVQAERAPIIATSLEKVVVSALGGVDGVAGAS